MSERSLVIEHGGQKYTGHIGTIKSTRLGVEDHGILTASVTIEWPGGGVSFGGYSLDGYNDTLKRRVPTAYGLDHIVKIIETVGVESWEAVRFSKVVALFDYSESGNTWGSMIQGIAHLTEDRVFIPKTHVEEWARGDFNG